MFCIRFVFFKKKIYIVFQKKIHFFISDGPLWTMNERFELIGNLIVDFFRGVELKKVCLQ